MSCSCTFVLLLVSSTWQFFSFKAQRACRRNSLFAVNYVAHTKRCRCPTWHRPWPWTKRMKAVLQVWGVWYLEVSCCLRFQPQEKSNDTVFLSKQFIQESFNMHAGKSLCRNLSAGISLAPNCNPLYNPSTTPHQPSPLNSSLLSRIIIRHMVRSCIMVHLHSSPSGCIRVYEHFRCKSWDLAAVLGAILGLLPRLLLTSPPYWQRECLS